MKLQSILLPFCKLTKNVCNAELVNVHFEHLLPLDVWYQNFSVCCKKSAKCKLLNYVCFYQQEEEIAAGTDGTFGGHRLFNCPARKGLFVPLYKCRKDKRFLEQCLSRSTSHDRSINFGSNETPDLEGTVSPPDSLEDISVVCGKGKGIQGHHNSCYMDATLLAMFYFTTVFDCILHRPKSSHDLPEYTEIQQVLKEGIVNPLRK